MLHSKDEHLESAIVGMPYLRIHLCEPPFEEIEVGGNMPCRAKGTSLID